MARPALARRTLHASAGGLALLLLGLLGASAAGSAGPHLEPISGAQLRELLDGKRGQVVLVNFWATWCRPCLKEIPELQALEKSHRARGLELVLVALDDPGDVQSIVVPFLGKWFPDLRTYVRTDSGMDATVSAVDPAWNEILPTTYLLDRRGTVAARLQGGKSPAEFEAALAPLLAAGGPDGPNGTR